MEFYQIEWSNGNTDVFENISDARNHYKNDVADILNYAITAGKQLDSSEVTLENQGAAWSENAKSLAENNGFDWEGE